jgi:hypothetical protein
VFAQGSFDEEMTSTLTLFLLRALMLWLILSACSLMVCAQRYQDFSTKTPLSEGEVLVIGFMGGRESWDNQTQGVRKMALKLRAMNLSTVHVETIENRKRHLAIELIRNAFDRNQDGRLDDQERTSTRLIIYGQSFGGAAVVKLAWQLEKFKIPVLLTIQIDSVGRDDKVIPANVARATNLFQRNGLIIKGERDIRAQEPDKTSISNHQFDYGKKQIEISEVAWWKKLFRVAHTKMDHDPEVWQLVENTIMDVILTPTTVRTAQVQQAFINKHLSKSCQVYPSGKTGRFIDFSFCLLPFYFCLSA